MNGPSSSATATTPDDEGVAAVVGIAVLLAIGVSVYAYELNTAVPRFGAEAERAWDGSLADSAAAFASGIDAGGASVSLVVPSPPQAEALDVMLIGRAEPAPPDGAVVFEPSCGSVSLEHETASGTEVEDLTDVTTGCLRIVTTPVFTDGYAYVVEFGGVLRIEGGRAVVLAGPPFETKPDDDGDQFSLTMPILEGPALAISSAHTGVAVDAAPRSWTSDDTTLANAAEVVLTLTTKHPEAWATWYGSRFEVAGFDAADYSAECVPAACDLDGDGFGTVRIELEGSGGTGNDIVLSLSTGTMAVDIG